jgi:hypothetical protein
MLMLFASLRLFSVFSVTASAGNEWMVQEEQEEESSLAWERPHEWGDAVENCRRYTSRTSGPGHQVLIDAHSNSRSVREEVCVMELPWCNHQMVFT